MAKDTLGRIRTAAVLALITGLWCWIITALHGAWSLGGVRGYFDGHMIPLYPSIPVTYSTFFMESLSALIAAFLLTLIWCSIVPQRLMIAGIVISWLAGFWFGADQISFVFQSDFGTTWAPSEAFRTLFWHPVVTPFVLVFGPISAATFTRRWRQSDLTPS